jgi:hypothetical protein
MLLDRLWQGYDIAYRWFRGVEDLPGDAGTVLRIGVERHRGRPVALADGTVVEAGDPVGIIHFNNEVVASIHDRTANPARAGILILRAFERSMETLARLSDGHPRYKAVKGYTATTIYHQGTRRAGFEVFPPRSTFAAKIVAAYARSVLARFHPLGAERARRARFARAQVIWISRAELCRRYAPAKSSPSATNS